MAPNLRPTLSTRIRASFDGKGSKSNIKNPQETNTFIVQDTAVLRDAIGQAINNDSFQSAIAAHLAKLIEPSIKEALDTIQPVVETVYQHDILLRKTNRSVEDLLQRFDTAAEKGDEGHGPDAVAGRSGDMAGSEEVKQLLDEHKTHNGLRFSELSSSVRESQGTMSQIATDMAEMKAALSLSSESLRSLKSTAQQSTTDTFRLQEQLDEMKIETSNILKSMETQSSTLVRIKEADLATAEILGAVQESHASHTVALDEIRAQDQSFKSASVPIFEKTHADTATAFQTLAVNLATLKENLKEGFASENESIFGLGTKVDAVISSIEAINGNDSSQEILANVQKSNDFHTAHATALEGIQNRLLAPELDKSIPIDNTNHIALTDHLNTITTTLDSHTSTLSALKQRADPEFRLNNIATTLDTHGSHLAAIKNGDKSVDMLNALHTSNESHVTHTKDLEEIRAATKAANESHASHATNLGEILLSAKAADASQTVHAADLAEIKSALATAEKSNSSHNKDLGEIKSAVAAANESHASHTATLEAIRAANDNTAQGTSSQSRSLDALENQMGTIIATLGSQSIVYSDIRDAVHASNEAHASHSTNLVDIKSAVKTAADSHASHATALEALKTAHETTTEAVVAQTRSLESLDSNIGSMKSSLTDQSAIHAETRDVVNASHTSHTTTLDSILAAHASTAAQIDSQASTLDAVGAQLGIITTKLEHQGNTNSGIKDAVQASNDAHASHAAALAKAETAHAEILGGVTGSRDLLAEHGEALASHKSLLEGVKAAQSESHHEVVNHLSELQSGVDAHGSAMKDLHAETTDSHAQIKDSVKALGDGVHLNEKGLGQVKEHVASTGFQKVVPITEDNTDLASRGVEAETNHPLVNAKTALGVGLGALTGGGLMAAAATDGLFSHERGSVEEAPVNEPVVEKSSATETVPGVREAEQTHVIESEPLEADPTSELVEARPGFEPIEPEPVIDPVEPDPASGHVSVELAAEPVLDEPNFEVESSLVDKPDAENKSIALEESVALEEPVALNESVALEEPVTSEELVTSEEPVTLNESVALEEPVTSEELVASEEPVALDESVALEEPAAVEESAAFEERADVEDFTAVEKPADVVDSKQAVETISEEPAAEANALHGLETEVEAADQTMSTPQIESSTEEVSMNELPEPLFDESIKAGVIQNDDNINDKSTFQELETERLPVEANVVKDPVDQETSEPTAGEKTPDPAIEGGGPGPAIEEKSNDLAVEDLAHQPSIAESISRKAVQEEPAYQLETSQDLKSIDEKTSVTDEIAEAENSADAEIIKEAGSDTTTKQPVLPESADAETIPEDSTKEVAHGQTRDNTGEPVAAEPERPGETTQSEPLPEVESAKEEPLHKASPASLGDTMQEPEAVHGNEPLLGDDATADDSVDISNHGHEAESGNHESIENDSAAKESPAQTEPPKEQPTYEAEKVLDEPFQDAAHLNEPIHYREPVTEELALDETEPKEPFHQSSMHENKLAMGEPNIDERSPDVSVFDAEHASRVEPAPKSELVEKVNSTGEIEAVKGGDPSLDTPEPQTEPSIAETQQLDELVPVREAALAKEPDLSSLSSDVGLSMEPETQTKTRSALEDTMAEEPIVESEAVGEPHINSKESIDVNQISVEPQTDESATGIKPTTTENLAIHEPAGEPAAREIAVENLADEPPVFEPLIEENAATIEASPDIGKPLEENEPSKDVGEMHEAASAMEKETIHEALPINDDKVTEDSSAKIEHLDDAEPIHEDELTTETIPIAEPAPEHALEESELGKPHFDTSAVNEPNTTNRDILADLTAGEPTTEVVTEPIQEGPMVDVEPRPTLTKRVSFKEPLTEVKRAPEINPVEEMPSVEETNAGEQPLDEELNWEEPSAGKAYTETGPAIEHSLKHEPTKEMEAVKEDSISEVQSSMDAHITPLEKENPTEAEKTVEAEPVMETKHSAEESIIEKPIGEEPIVESLSNGVSGASHEEVEPAMKYEVAQEPAAGINSLEEVANHPEEAAVEEQPSSVIKSVEEGPAIEAEHAREALVEPEEEVEPDPDLTILKGAVSKDPESLDEAAQEPVGEEPVVKSKDASGELHTEPVHETTKLGPVVHEMGVHNNAADQPTIHDLPADKSTVEESATTAEIPVAHKPVMDEPVVEEPLRKETKLEESSLEEPSNKAQPGKEEVSSKEIIPKPETMATEPSLEESAVHEDPVVGDPIEHLTPGHPVANGTNADDSTIIEPVMHELTPGKSVIEEDVVDKPVLEQPITKKAVEEPEAVEQESISENPHAENSTATEPPTESESIVKDELLETEPQKPESQQPGDAEITVGEKVSTKGSLVDENHPQEKEEVKVAEDQAMTSNATMEEPALEHPTVEEPAGNGLAGEEINQREEMKEAGTVESMAEAEPVKDETKAGEINDKEPILEMEPVMGNPATEIEPVNDVVHTMKDDPSPKVVAEDVEATVPGLSVHDPIVKIAAEPENTLHEPIMHERAVDDKPVIHEQVTEEITPGIQLEDPVPSPPTKAMPARVDSGIDVDSPTDVKSAADFMPLLAVQEHPSVADTAVGEQMQTIATKDLTVPDATIQEPATEPESQTGKATVDEPTAKAKSVSDEAPDEFHNAESEPPEKEAAAHEPPTDEDHFFDAEDQPTAASQPAAQAEPAHEKPLSKLKHAMESLFHRTPATGDAAGEATEAAAAAHAEKDLHVDVKPATREQHTRVDSGIDVETPMAKEPLGKLEPVVEVKRATEVDGDAMAA